MVIITSNWIRSPRQVCTKARFLRRLLRDPRNGVPNRAWFLDTNRGSTILPTIQGTFLIIETPKIIRKLVVITWTRIRISDSRSVNQWRLI